ncbi:MAG: hypothetical protein AB7I37_18525 [Pirellulales bacterium]
MVEFIVAEVEVDAPVVEAAHTLVVVEDGPVVADTVLRVSVEGADPSPADRK